MKVAEHERDTAARREAGHRGVERAVAKAVGGDLRGLRAGVGRIGRLAAVRLCAAAARANRVARQVCGDAVEPRPQPQRGGAAGVYVRSAR